MGMKSVLGIALLTLFLLGGHPVPAQTVTTTDSAPATTTTSTTTTSATTFPPPDSTVSGTVTTTDAPGASTPVNLTEDQREKIRRTLKAQQANEEQRKRQAELLDRTPVLEQKVNPGMTEKQSIPKRF